MPINERDSYLARGDTLVNGGQGPDELVVETFQILSGTRYKAQLEAEATLRRFATTAPQHGGHDLARKGRVFESIKVVPGTGSTFSFLPSIPGYDVGATIMTGHCPKRAEDGKLLAAPASSWQIDTTNLNNVDIPYEDGGGLFYNVGILVSAVPSKAEQSPRKSGKFEITQETAVVGVAVEAFDVTYNAGLNQITLVCGNHKFFGDGSSLAGRAALAWYIDDDGFVRGTTATAVQLGTLTFNGTRNELVLPGAFGQDLSSVDLDETNYFVCLLGPSVWVGAKDTDNDGVAWLAHGDNPTWECDGQNRYPSTFGMLENFIRMTLPSETLPDKVSIPKISIRPNDNEAGTSRQIEVWKDAAATMLAFAVNKDGDIFFDGGLTVIGTSAFPIGVDDANGFPVNVLELFHTHSSGVGVIGKGPKITFTVETSPEATREELGTFVTEVTDVTPGAVKGSVMLGVNKGFAAASRLMLLSQNGRTFFAHDSVTDHVGPSAAHDPAVDTVHDASVIAIGDDSTKASMAVHNVNGGDLDGDRTARFKAYGNLNAGGRVDQGELLWEHDGAVADSKSRAGLFINNGTILAEALRGQVFDDFTGSSDQTGTKLRHIRAFSDADGIRFSTTQAALTGPINQFNFLLNSSTNFATFLANDVESRLSWGFDTSDSNNTDVAWIGVRPNALLSDMLFGSTLSNGLLMNLHYGLVGDRRVEIYQQLTNDPDPFTGAQDRSPLLVTHDEEGSDALFAGIDIGNNSASVTNKFRATAINFLGRRAPTHHRLACIKVNYDADTVIANYPGRLSLLVNGGAGVSDLNHALQMYPDGSILCNTIPIWAYAVDGNTIAPAITGVSGDNVGFSAIAAHVIGTGTYLLTTTHAHTGGNPQGQVHVSCRQLGIAGFGFWNAGGTTVTVQTFDTTTGLAADALAFFVTAFNIVTPKA